jgi:hypothetical protein
MTELDDVIVSMSKLQFGIHLITRRPTIVEAFGENCILLPQSRDTQINEILRSIRKLDGKSIKSKCGSLFFHASPGVGKTFLLSQLYSMNARDIHFFVADFNRNSCDDAAPHSNVFLHDPELFILLRLYYVECVDQSKHTWIGFLNKILTYMSTIDSKEVFKDVIRKMLQERVVQSGCRLSVILVDEILKTQIMCRGSVGVEFSNRCRSYLCRMADTYTDICNLVVFSSLDVSFMMDEITASG